MKQELKQISMKGLITFMTLSILLFGTVLSAFAQKTGTSKELDATVERFLDENRRNWHDLNVPYQDGKTLFNLIVKNNYTRALEIGTSTGHSSIWIAWALSKTGD